LPVIDLQKGIVDLPTAHPMADAMTDMSADAHHNSITRISPRLGETGTTPEIVGLLEAASHGKQRSA
jgi:isochorismate hydrolase